ncbi:MAG: S41 family peptidase, partial [Acidobacteriota bacterium]
AYLEANSLRFRSWGTEQADEALGLMDIFSGPKNTPLALKVKDRDGGVRSVSLIRNSTTRDGRRFQCRVLDWNAGDPLIETRMVGPNVCYIRLSNFDDEKIVEEFRKIFDGLDLSRLPGLILDVRYNPGGSTDNGYGILRFLVDRPIKGSKWKSLSYVPAHRSWGRQTGWIEAEPATIEPMEGQRFAGPLVVLTGPATFSSAEDFLVPLQFSRRAVLVGEKTAGSTGNPIYVDLPGGGKFKVVSKRDLFPDGREWVGIGIQPDVEVHPTQKDILEGKDPVLQKAIEVIGNWAAFRR